MIIEVSKKNINEGTPGNPLLCPITYAIKDAYGKKYGPGNHLMVSVGYDGSIEASHISIHSPPYIKRWIPGEQVSEFVRRYDKGMHVEPFEFEIQGEL